jgi:hypothetical protein
MSTVTKNEAMHTVCEFARKTCNNQKRDHLNGHTFESQNGFVSVAAHWNVVDDTAMLNICYIKSGKSSFYRMTRSEVFDTNDKVIDFESVEVSGLVSVVQQAMYYQNELLRKHCFKREAIPD